MTLLHRLSLIIVCVLACGLPHVARAEKSGPAATVAVVDMQRILQESLAAKSVQQKLDVQRSKFQTETESEENELRQAEQELSKTHDQLAASVYADREQQLRQRFLAVEQRVDGRRKVLDKSYSDAMNAVHAPFAEYRSEGGERARRQYCAGQAADPVGGAFFRHDGRGFEAIK